MGNLSALPALAVQTPTPRDPLEEFARVAQIRSQMQSQQAQQQEMQIRQQQINDQQATTAAMKNWDPSTGDYDALAKSVLQNGGSANAATAIQKHGLDVKTATEALSEKQLADFKAHQEAFADRLGPLTDPSIVPDEQLPGKALQTVNDLVQNKLIDPAHAAPLQQGIQSVSDPAQLRQLILQTRNQALGASAIAAQKKTTAETEEATGKARESNAAAALKEIEAKGLQGLTPEFVSQQVDNVFDPNSTTSGGQNRLVKAQALGALARGDVQGAKQILDEGFKSALEEKKAIATETNPAVQNAKVALAQRIKRAEQAITQGDPTAAGKLLADGSVTLSELKSRGTTPDFIVQATNAAQKLNPGFNPQKAEADLAVAKSPANLSFFGSAKSLTDKGGTLDQLAAAAKDIPSNQIPVFNTVADWEKAATGSGPIAKYAALALGVADDYSKVMGGGQGSDTSRKQALDLIAAKESPEQKAASLEGIRGAVKSQTRSRIGNNSILKNMYGDDESAPAANFFSQFGGKSR